MLAFVALAACTTARLHPIRPVTDEAPVVVYGTSWCEFTRAAVAWLAEHEVPYVMQDVERDHDARSRMDDLVEGAGVGTVRVPVIDVGGRVLVGYDEAQLDRALHGEE